MPSRQLSRVLKRIASIALIAIVLVAVFATSLSRILIDYWWFGELRQRDTWGTLWAARLVPSGIALLAVAAFVTAQVVIARRFAVSSYDPRSAEDVSVARMAEAVGARSRWLWAGAVLLVSGMAAIQVGQHWNLWLLFRNSTSFGTRDPQFGKDVGFYVFDLPWWRFITDWAFGVIVVTIIVTLIAHYLWGGFRVQPPFHRVTTAVKIHISVLLALAAGLKAVQYWLNQYELMNSNRGVVRGASATDVAASLPGLQLMVLVASISAVLFLVNIRRGGFTLPALATVLIIGVRLIVGVAYPLGYQQFKVSPNELSAERTYIQRNIDATRTAFDLANVKTQRFSGSQKLTADMVASNPEGLRLARLWDPDEMRANFVQDQQFATYYTFADGDVDRYTVDGKQVPVVVGARELAPSKLPSQSWLNTHLVYTHGYGMVIAPTNEVQTDGGPEYLLGELPPQGTPKITRPEIYFGDSLEGFAIVDTKVAEFDHPQDEKSSSTQYAGSAGIRLDSIFKKLAFSVDNSDTRLLISSEIEDRSRILINRGVRERAQALAPFLSYDADPYPVAHEGRIVWVLDAYTTTANYPYSQTFGGSGGLEGPSNYVRNSVKVTMDAYDGTMTLYVMDDKDPILKAWRKAFPAVFTSGSKMPEGIREHLRYPEDLFRLQTDVYAKYHITDPTAFYNNANRWEVAEDPGSGVVSSTAGGTEDASSDTATEGAISTGRRIDPYYVLTKRPGSDTVEFLLIRPFVPVSRDELSNLSGFMTASSDPATYGQLSAYELPSGVSVAGPSIVNARINGDQAISSRITLLGNRGTGSRVIQGSLQLLPVQEALVYVRPYYVENTEGRRLPKFSFVVVYANGRAAGGASVNEALVKLRLATADTTPTGPTSPSTSIPGSSTPTPAATVQSLLSEAQDQFAKAEEALQKGDLGGYQKAVEKAKNAVADALAAQEKSTP